jgi:hypothetical protein
MNMVTVKNKLTTHVSQKRANILKHNICMRETLCGLFVRIDFVLCDLLLSQRY